MLDFRVGNGRQVPMFREVLANETIGVLVQATFPGGIRMREVDLGLKVMRHAFMVAELASIVIGDRMHPVLCGVSASVTALRTASAVFWRRPPA